jgi:acyl CoA:acetate/3-ketoacid CoA transferase
VKGFVGENDLKNGKVIFGPLCPTKKNKNADPIRLKIATRAAKEVKDGMYINLGIGIPTLLPSVLPEGIEINLQSENGIMGVGSFPTLDKATGKNINAGKVRDIIVRKPSLSKKEDPTSPLQSPSLSLEENIST